MPEFIHCPSCQRRLQVAASLTGQSVQCPMCGASFTAAMEPSSPSRPSREPPPPSPRWSGSLGEMEREEEIYPDYGDEFPGPRRDLTPHRGSTILILGILSLMFCLVGAILGPIAWILGNQDLTEIQAGRMDPEGEGPTNTGRICGIIGTLLNVVFLAFFCLSLFFRHGRF